MDQTRLSSTSRCRWPRPTCSLGGEILQHLRPIALVLGLNAEPPDVSADEIPLIGSTILPRMVDLERGNAHWPHDHLSLLRIDVLRLTIEAIAYHGPQVVSTTQVPRPLLQPIQVQHRKRNTAITVLRCCGRRTALLHLSAGAAAAATAASFAHLLRGLTWRRRLGDGLREKLLSHANPIHHMTKYKATNKLTKTKEKASSQKHFDRSPQ